MHARFATIDYPSYHAGLVEPPFVVHRDSALSTYYDYLSAHLSLPFEAIYFDEERPLDDSEQTALVFDLLDPDVYPGNDSVGLLCRAKMDGREVEVPLAELVLYEGSINAPFVEDYWRWFWDLK